MYGSRGNSYLWIHTLYTLGSSPEGTDPLQQCKYNTGLQLWEYIYSIDPLYTPILYWYTYPTNINIHPQRVTRVLQGLISISIPVRYEPVEYRTYSKYPGYYILQIPGIQGYIQVDTDASISWTQRKGCTVKRSIPILPLVPLSQKPSTGEYRYLWTKGLWASARGRVAVSIQGS